MKKPPNFTDVEFELYQLLLLHSILDDEPVRSLSAKLCKVLHVDTLKDDERNQKLAITYLTTKLNERGKCFEF